MSNFTDRCHRCGCTEQKMKKQKMIKIDWDSSTSVITCPACDSRLETSQGRLLKNKNRIKLELKRQMTAAINSRDFKNVGICAKEIEALEPGHFLARFCGSLAARELGDSKDYENFLNSKPDVADNEYPPILEYAIKFLAIADREMLRSFIENVRNMDMQNEWKEKLNKAIEEERKKPKAKAKTTEYEVGNTSGNIMNYGLVAYKDGWLYYSNGNDGYKLYKKHDDKCAEGVKLSNHICRYINVVNEWVYYVSIGGRLYRTHINSLGGGNEEDLKYDRLKYVNVVGNQVYCSSEDHNNNLCMINIDTGQMEFMDDGECEYVAFNEGHVYYTRADKGGQLYRILADCSAKPVLVCEDDCACLNVCGEWVYYLNADDSYRIYKIRKTGKGGNDGKGEKTILSNDTCRAINVNVSDHFIYYISGLHENKLCRISINTNKPGSPMPMYDGNADMCRYVNIANDWIYYRNRSDSNKLYMVKMVEGKIDRTCTVNG